MPLGHKVTIQYCLCNILLYLKHLISAKNTETLTIIIILTHTTEI